MTVGDPIGRWLELEGVFTIPGFGDVELAGGLGWEPGAGLVYRRRLNDSQVWRAGITVTAPPGRSRRGGRAVAVSCRAVHPPSAGPRRDDRRRVTLREPARYRP